MKTILAILLSATLVYAIQHGDRPYAPHQNGTRSPVLGLNGMVATSQPLASAAALRVLQDGGNAVDAAIAAAAVLNVVEPMMTGVGGDMFALVYMQADKKPVGLNGSGWAGSKATVDFFKSRKMDRIPSTGIYSVSVPGAVAGWFKLHGKYGKLPMSRILQPAIDYAENGYPVSEIIAGQWKANENKLKQNPEAAAAYLVDGKAPVQGQIMKFPNLAKTLRILAQRGRDAFYKGEIAEKIVAVSDKMDGTLTAADFRDYDAQWIDPITTNYRGYDVYELPPNTQGLVVLEMLNIMEGFDLKSMGHNTAPYLHTLVEAKRLAFADRDAYIADPAKAEVPLQRLISKPYAAERRALIRPDSVNTQIKAGVDEEADTVYLTVVDKDRNVVSFINSLYDLFGSGVVAGDTGIMLHDRGGQFQLDPAHPNRVEPRKRPFHTLIPGMILKDGKVFMSFGVMSGDMQAQGHAQVVANVVDFGMDVQFAGEAPRFRHSGQNLQLESQFPMDVRAALMKLGHVIVSAGDAFGGYQGIMIDPRTGVLMGGSDVRKDGLAIGW